jgi:hypothetical protein
LSGSHHSESTLRQSGSLSGSFVLPDAAIPEEEKGSTTTRQESGRFGRSNIDLLEERRERELVTGLQGPNESQGVNSIEKDLVNGMGGVAVSDTPTRPRSGTGDARVQQAQQKAAGEYSFTSCKSLICSRRNQNTSGVHSRHFMVWRSGKRSFVIGVGLRKLAE